MAPSTKKLAPAKRNSIREVDDAAMDRPIAEVEEIVAALRRLRNVTVKGVAGLL